MTPEGSFEQIMVQLRAGDEDVARQVLRHFEQPLVQLIHRQFDGLMRRKEDPAEVAQSAFKSFFRGCADGRFELDNWEDLWGLLAVIALRKCAHRARSLRARRRDARREVRLADTGSEEHFAALPREASPPETAILNELVEGIFAGLDSDDRTILALSIQGQSTTEIAGRMGCTERTVQRVRQRVRQRLERAWDLSNPDD
jgi:RNA polymerase sigma factor (sigma-70 family)